MDTVRNLRTSMTVYPYTYTPGLVKKKNVATNISYTSTRSFKTNRLKLSTFKKCGRSL